MISDLLVDTCVAIWLLEGRTLSRKGTIALNESVDLQRSVVLSPVVAWEFGMLEARRRLALRFDALSAYRVLSTLPATRTIDLTPEILVASTQLPGSPHGDPFDRIVMATARLEGLTVLTSDRKILAYADAGYIAAIPCSPIRS
ncbi:type II toxin-antitoxin system VapC family toxin [Mongoliimonas terrestris]|uniref:type II toxin-antitoxin system VapC family toxin n=1 Tax=Mongoliimonas terrestris TaxID=1709001 RepID=UPI000AC5A277|nr:type II toxin-antitoxin system VapC family toxin [Mongoliimonas terrestris]